MAAPLMLRRHSNARKDAMSEALNPTQQQVVALTEEVEVLRNVATVYKDLYERLLTAIIGALPAGETIPSPTEESHVVTGPSPGPAE